MKGSSVPIDIYTYDCLQDQVFREERKRTSKTDVKIPGKTDVKLPGKTDVKISGKGNTFQLKLKLVSILFFKTFYVFLYTSPLPSPPLSLILLLCTLLSFALRCIASVSSNLIYLTSLTVVYLSSLHIHRHYLVMSIFQIPARLHIMEGALSLP